MLSFITFRDAPEQLEIIVDGEGVDELITYLQSVKRNKDHMHLVIGTELDAYPIGNERKGKTMYAKHVRIEFGEPKNWQELNNGY